MARSMLHSPFAQQHPHSSSSRVSAFQQSATAGSPHGLELDDIEASWMGSEYGRRQHFLDVFEPMGSASRSSSVQHRDQDQQRQGRLASSHVGIVLANDVLHSSSSSSLASPTQPHIIRARAILTTSVSAREHMPSTHPVGLPRLHTTASLGRVDSPRGHGSSGSSSSSGSTASMRRLQRRSTSLLAATSATASNLWSSLSALGDRSRALLCRSSPVLDSGTSPGSRNSSSINSGRSRSSSVDGGSRRSSPVLQGTGPPVTASAVFLPESVVGTGASRSPRLSGRLLLRSTAIRRSSGARSPAVLIDIDATDSYDDLLALDQFNVKRAVKPSVLKALPVRVPDARDQQQQRQCHICMESWQPVFAFDSDTAPAGPRDAGVRGAGRCQGCCGCCGQQHHQQQAQTQQQLPQLLDNPQHQTHGLSMVCWTAGVVPAPSSPRLLPDDTGLGTATSDELPSSGGSSGGSSSGSSSSGGSSGEGQPVVRGWTQFSSAHVLHQQGGGHSRANPATAAAGTLLPPVSHVSHAQTAGRGAGWRVVDSSSNSSGSSSSAGHGAAQMCGCVKAGGDQAGCCGQRAPEGVQIQQLPCGHEFCSDCIQTWLKDHTSCPVCRWSFPESDTRLINK